MSPLVVAFIKAQGLRRHDGGHGMLVNKLRLPVATQEDAKIIEPSDDTLQFHPVDKEDCHRNFCFTDLIEKCVLKILSV